jgi:hypothetical protein
VAKNPNVIGMVLRRWSKKLLPFLRRKPMEEAEVPQKPAEPTETEKMEEKAEEKAEEPVASASGSRRSTPGSG